MVSSAEQEIILSDFRGGLNLSVPPSKIADNELSVAKNIVLDQSGGVRSRPGDIAINLNRSHTVNGDLVVNDLKYFFGTYLTGQGELILFEGDTSEDGIEMGGGQKYLAGIIQPLMAKNWNNVTADLNGNGRKVLEYNHKLYVLSESATSATIKEITFELAMADIDAITFAAGPADRAFFEGIFHKDRLFGVCTAGNLNQRLYYSDIGTPLVYDPAGFIDIMGTDPSAILAFEVIYDNLYIFKQNSIWQLTTEGLPEEWILRQVNTDLGVADYGAVLEVGGIIYFVSTQGIFAFDGVNFTNIGSKVFDPIIEKDAAVSIYYVTRTHEIQRLNNLLIFRIEFAYYGTDSLVEEIDIEENIPPCYVFVYDLNLNAWVEWTFINKNVYADNGTSLWNIDKYSVKNFVAIAGSKFVQNNVWFVGPEDEIEEMQVLFEYELPVNRLYKFMYDDPVMTDQNTNLEIQTKHYDFGYPGRIKTNKFNTVVYNFKETANITNYELNYQCLSDIGVSDTDNAEVVTFEAVQSVGNFKEIRKKVYGCGQFFSAFFKLFGTTQAKLEINSISMNIDIAARISRDVGV